MSPLGPTRRKLLYTTVICLALTVRTLLTPAWYAADPLIRPHKQHHGVHLNITAAMRSPHQVIEHHCDTNYQGIADSRRLQHHQAAQWLRRIEQYYPTVPFDHATDLFVFEHVTKTGGTLFSELLEDRFGKNSVVPGSRLSDKFRRDELLQAMRQQNANNSSQATSWWDTQRVAFWQQSLDHRDNEDNLQQQEWFLAQIPTATRRRTWLGTLYRNPLEWLASHYWDQCVAASGTKDAQSCTQLQKRGQDLKPHCRSAADFASSDVFRNQLRDNPHRLVAAAQNESAAELEKRTLQLYGGLVTPSSPLAHNNLVPMSWIGLTERYQESLILFYDWMGWPLDAKFASHISSASKRFTLPCGPASFWSADEQLELSRIMWRSWVVHNVANAVLDVRMAEWCCRRKHRRKETVELDMFHQYCEGDTATV